MKYSSISLFRRSIYGTYKTFSCCSQFIFSSYFLYYIFSTKINRIAIFSIKNCTRFWISGSSKKDSLFCSSFTTTKIIIEFSREFRNGIITMVIY
nr:MAG TPA: hypothetical protein [Caudoviricetes sp.]